MNTITSKAVAAYKVASNMSSHGGMGKDNLTIGQSVKKAQRSMEPAPVGTVTPIEKPVTPKFDALVAQGLEKARSSGYRSEAVSTEAIAEKAELHDLVTSVANAELTLNTVVALRDRLVTAYQDIIKMPI